MKKIFNHSLLFYPVAAFMLLMVSCKKDGLISTAQTGSFATGSLTATPSTLVLTQSAQNDTTVTFKWPAAYFGEKLIVNYTLQLDLPTDTSGANAWANAKTYAVGSNILNYSFITKDLNSLVSEMGLAAGVSSQIAVRVKADVPQYNGSSSSISPSYSNTLVLNVTPYSLTLYIPGAYQGWDPTTAPELNAITGKPGLYEAYIYITGSGVQYFKYTNARDWNHTNYGDGGNGTFSTDGAAAGLSVPDGGYYELTANLNNNTWTATKTTWGIIGDATPGGWSNDTQMAYDATNQVWKVTVNMLHNGSFKFRANNAWNIDFGIDGSGNLVYADNPFFGYTSGLNNLTVPSDGNYTITLDLHTSGKYLYTMVKN
jgi:hypothetical protein